MENYSFESRYLEEEKFVHICGLLLMSGEYEEKDIEDLAHKILDDPSLFDQYIK